MCRSPAPVPRVTASGSPRTFPDSTPSQSTKEQSMSRRMLVRVVSACLILASALAVSPGSTLAVQHPVFDIVVGDCWRGQAPDEHAQVQVTWKDGAGHLVDSFTVESQ